MSKSYDIQTTSQGLTLEEADSEITRLLNALADARTESMRLRAALRGLIGAVADHTSQKSIPQALTEARAELEEGRT